MIRAAAQQTLDVQFKEHIKNDRMRESSANDARQRCDAMKRELACCDSNYATNLDEEARLIAVAARKAELRTDIASLEFEIEKATSSFDKLLFFGSVCDIVAEYYTNNVDVAVAVADDEHVVSITDEEPIVRSDNSNYIGELNQSARKRRTKTTKKKNIDTSMLVPLSFVRTNAGTNNKSKLSDVFAAITSVVEVARTVVCVECGVEKIFVQHESYYMCMQCGEIEFCSTDDEPTMSREFIAERTKMPPKRSNRLVDRLLHYQSRETCVVPAAAYKKIIEYFRRHRVDVLHVAPHEVRNALSVLRMTKYYTNVPQIWYRLTNTAPYVLEQNEIDLIQDIYTDLEQAYRYIKSNPDARFLHTPLLMGKMMTAIGRPEFTRFTNVLNSISVKEQDRYLSRLFRMIGVPYPSGAL